MRRISGPTAIELSAGKLGFVDENLAGPVEGTDVTAAWLNAVQEEICAVIEGAGITLDPDDSGQLKDALDARAGRGALFALAAAQTIAAATETSITWPAAVYDDAGFWSAGAPARITIPAGVSRVRFTGQAGFNTSAVGGRSLRIRQNGSGEGIGLPSALIAAQSSVVPTPVGLAGGIVAVTAGDYFEFRVQHDAGGPLDLNAGITWLHVEWAR